MWDAELVFSEGQAFTAAQAHNSTNTLDLGAGVDAFGTAKIRDASNMWLNIVVKDAVTSTGSATVAFDLQDSANDSSFATTGISVSAVGKATLVAGYTVLKVKIKRGHRRYLKIVYTVAVEVLATGSFNAWLSEDSEKLS